MAYVVAIIALAVAGLLSSFKPGHEKQRRLLEAWTRRRPKK